MISRICPDRIQQVCIILVSVYCMRCIFEICQIVASINANSQFHNFFNLISGGILTLGPTVDCVTEDGGRWEQGRCKLHATRLSFYMCIDARYMKKNTWKTLYLINKRHGSWINVRFIPECQFCLLKEIKSNLNLHQ